MRNEREKITIYSFSCPLPCNREIRVEAKNILDAIDKIIKAGAIGCRSGKKQFLCEKRHLDMPQCRKINLNILSVCVPKKNAKHRGSSGVETNKLMGGANYESIDSR
jgi:hypothetical protein